MSFGGCCSKVACQLKHVNLIIVQGTYPRGREDVEGEEGEQDRPRAQRRRRPCRLRRRKSQSNWSNLSTYDTIDLPGFHSRCT